MEKCALSRRDFIRSLAGTGCALGLGVGCTAQANDPTPVGQPPGVDTAHPARFWHAMKQNAIQCELCPHGCTIEPKSTGFCRVRYNKSGKLVSLAYGAPVTYHNDPIEKKPLNHVLPGTTAFSLATLGCNLTCQHCQNWELSQAKPGDLPSYGWSPGEVARRAKEAGSSSVAFTYNEPTIWTEYVSDTIDQAQALKIPTVMISNGFIQQTPQRELARKLFAYKVDLKGFTEKFYSDICGAHLKPVLDGMVRIKEEGCWLEIVTLLIPTLNDSPQELKALVDWVNANLGPDVPIHFTRFMPMYRLRNLPRTPVETLETAHKIAKDKGLHFPYIGNVPGHPAGDTYCPHCGEKLIARYGFSPNILALKNGKCIKCQTAIPGRWTV